ncbi:MAG: hypothetical protein JWP31_254 [Aeromicrobium sp.]|nr:hypothetical protein [Aeromicrobium sp.]
MSEQRPARASASTGQLLVQATEDISRLIHDEIELAKRDLAESGKRLGAGAGLFGLAGSLALYGVGALIAAAILGIAEGLEPWIAAAIVAGVLFVAAAVAALVGKMSVGRVAEAPRARAQSVKADVAAVKHGTAAESS